MKKTRKGKNRKRMHRERKNRIRKNSKRKQHFRDLSLQIRFTGDLHIEGAADFDQHLLAMKNSCYSDKCTASENTSCPEIHFYLSLRNIFLLEQRNKFLI